MQVQNVIMPFPKWVKMQVCIEVTGETVDSLKHKRASGTWVEGVHYKKGPDGFIRYNLRAIDEWIDNDGYHAHQKAV